MKKILTLSFLSFLLFSCDKNDIDDTYSDHIKGTWQLVERYASIGGAPWWSPVIDGYTYTFAEDNILITDRYDCNGTYTINNGRLEFNFNCDNMQAFGTFKMEFENSLLILTPDPPPCDEGCAEKFRRVITD